MHTRLAAAPLLGLVVLIAACSSGASPTAAPATPAPATPAPATEAPTPAPTDAPPATGAAVMAADTTLGNILTDGQGMTLYIFLPDNAGDPTCYEGCAASWPPLLSDGAPSVATGLAAAVFTTVARTDGGSQVAVNGWPLYTFAGDSAPGDVKGQGLNDVWFVVGKDGTPIGAPAAGGAAVNLASTSLGDVLVDGAGLTLYMFTADTDGSSACYGDCATNWPPLLLDAVPSVGAGLDSEDFGSITRDDGTTQVTFYGMPLYTFAGDRAPGDVNGQGLGGKWYVLGADGTVLKSGAPDGY
jgi:predicted lipoprotein with Yx(FWY)xxD motif